MPTIIRVRLFWLRCGSNEGGVTGAEYDGGGGAYPVVEP
jgi:hypothetical protein